MLFQDVGCGAVPVIDAGQPIGILTDREVALAVPEVSAVGREVVAYPAAVNTGNVSPSFT